MQGYLRLRYLGDLRSTFRQVPFWQVRELTPKILEHLELERTQRKESSSSEPGDAGAAVSSDEEVSRRKK